MKLFLDEKNFDPMKGKSYYYTEFLCSECATTRWRDFHDILFDENQSTGRLPPIGPRYPCAICKKETLNVSRGNITRFELKDRVEKAFNEWKLMSEKYQGYSDEYENWITKWRSLREERI